LEADRASLKRFHGHGNALAQVYNHLIMPLANTRDKLTQIRWGLGDFRHRFGRSPEGMWLAETAVDIETLRLMAREGIKFTILAQGQAQAVRRLTKDNGKMTAPGRPEETGGGAKAGAADQTAAVEPWREVTGGGIDPRRPYRIILPDDGPGYLDVFFYDGSTSRAVAFEKLLSSGSGFLARLEQAFGRDDLSPRLVNLATDGESYGHHFKFGDMALAWVFKQLEQEGSIKIINYGSFLEMFPPEYEVKIIENTSWSCVHGIERWRSDCGCHVGGPPEWNQKWRTPLRDGLNWLRDEAAAVFQDRGGSVFKDPWAARDDYVSILLEPTDQNREEFLKRHLARSLTRSRRTEALGLLESQLMCLYMFTSCGWFFDDLSGLEPVQDLEYAARAIDLIQRWGGKNLEAGLLDHLAQAKPNNKAFADGVEVYRKAVLPSRMDDSRAAAHFALRGLVDEGNDLGSPVTRTVHANRLRRLFGPGVKAILGQVTVEDETTGSHAPRTILALHPGDIGLFCLVSEAERLDFKAMTKAIQPALDEASLDRVAAAFTQRFPKAIRYGLPDLLPEVKSYIALSLGRGVFAGFRDWAREAFQSHENIMSILVEAGEELPETASLILRVDTTEGLKELFDTCENRAEMDWDRLRILTAQAKRWGVVLTDPDLNRQAQEFLVCSFDDLAQSPSEKIIREIIEFQRLGRDLDIYFDLWASQNNYWRLWHSPDFLNHLDSGVKPAFLELGRELGFAVAGENHD
ncbi:MAG: DUF3536 domain-containing protein, partial [Pseudomonadota bacterium]